MKVKFEFNLPEDQEDYNIFSNASKMHNAICIMQEYLRSQIKYSEDDMSEDAYDAYRDCQITFNNVLIENNIEI